MLKTIFEKEQVILERQTVDIIVGAILRLLKKQPHVVFGLPGGRSVGGIFKLLAQDQRLDWSRVHIFMVDERLVSLNEQDSNFKLVKDSLINPLVSSGKLPQANVHPFIFDQNKQNLGIIEYAVALKQLGAKYDIILLSVGEDGHVAGLFPHHHSIQAGDDFYLVMADSPKPPSQRMSASRNLLLKSQYAVILFFGQTKHPAYNNFLADNLTVNDCPAKIIKEIKNSYLVTNLQ